MRQFIAIMVIVLLVCCLAFCEEPPVTPYNQTYEKKAAVEKVEPKPQPKKKSDNPVSMF